MTDDDATRQCERLAELFNDATPEKLSLLRGNFLRHDRDVVGDAITRYAERNRFLDVSDVMSAVHNEGRRRLPPNHAPPLDEQQSKHWKPVDQAIAALSDEELAAHAAAVLPTLPEGFRRIAEARGPRNSATLKALIYERVKATV